MTRKARGGANEEQDMIPKKRQHHHSYDERTNEPADLIEEETVEVEAELPSEESPLRQSSRTYPIRQPSTVNNQRRERTGTIVLRLHRLAAPRAPRIA
jgi:hypothetical protein